MGFSRVRRKELILTELVEGAVCQSDDDEDMDQDTFQNFQRLRKAKDHVRKMIAQVNEHGGIVFDDRKDYNRYQFQVEQVSRDINKLWPAGTLDAREFVNALLAMVSRMASSPGWTAELWAHVEEELQALYERMDPELKHVPSMDYGERAADKIEEILNRA